jgi:hypothetical protein
MMPLYILVHHLLHNTPINDYDDDVDENNYETKKVNFKTDQC